MPEFKVTDRDTGSIVHPGAYVFDRDGIAYTLVRATRPASMGQPGRVVIADERGREAEYLAPLFGLTVSYMVPQHNDPATGRWCAFSGCSSITGFCPVHGDVESPPAS